MMFLDEARIPLKASLSAEGVISHAQSERAPHQSVPLCKVRQGQIRGRGYKTLYSEKGIQRAGSRVWTDDDEWSASTGYTTPAISMY